MVKLISVTQLLLLIFPTRPGEKKTVFVDQPTPRHSVTVRLDILKNKCKPLELSKLNGEINDGFLSSHWEGCQDTESQHSVTPDQHLLWMVGA